MTEAVPDPPEIDWRLKKELKPIFVDLNTIRVLMMTLDHQGRIVSFNQACEQTTGYSFNEVRGRFIWELFLIPEEVEPFKATYEKLKPGSALEYKYESYWVAKDGIRRRIAWSNSVLLSNKDTVEYIICSGIDITDYEVWARQLNQQNQCTQVLAKIALKIRQSLQLEEILQTTVTEVRNLLGCDRVLIYRLWSDGTGSGVTEAVVTSCPTILGKTFEPEVFPEEYRKLYTCGRIRAIEDVETGGISPCLVEFMQQTGVKAKLVVPILLKEELWGLLIVHQCAQPRQWSSFEIELLKQLADQVSIALAQAQHQEHLEQLVAERTAKLTNTNKQLQQEIADRKQAEKALRESEERWRSLVQNAPDIIFTCERDGKLLFINRTVPGITVEQTIGTSVYDYIPPEDQDILRQSFDQVFQTGEPVYYETTGTGANGITSWYASRVGAVKHDGQVAALMVVATDITERKRAEAALRQQAFREQALNQVVRAIRRSLDLETIFSTAVEEIGKLLHVDRAVIVQYLPERQLWLNVADYRQRPDLPVALGLEIPDEGNEIAARLKRSEVVLSDEASRSDDEINRGFSQTFPGAWLLVPLHFGSSVWGSLSLVVENRPYPWQDSEVELSLAVAEQLAIAIQQAQLYKQSRTATVKATAQALKLANEIAERKRTEDTLRSLYKISTARKRSFDQRLQGLLALGRRCFGLQMGALGRVENNLYEVIAAQVAPKLNFPIAKGNIWDVEQTYCYVTIGRKEPVAFESAGTSHWRTLPAYASTQLEAYIGMPVIVAGKVYGSLSFFSLPAHHQPFTAGDKELLKLMAQWVGALLERQQAEEALQESETRFRSLVANIPGAVYRCAHTPDWNGMFISDAIEDIVGYPAADFSSSGTRTFASIIYPEDIELVKQVVDEAVRARQPFTLEYRLVHSDGSNRWVYERGQGMFDDSGELLYLDGVIFDITQRKQAEEELKQSEARFRELAQKEALLNQLANQIRCSLDLNTILETAVRQIRNLLQIDQCCFLWYRPNHAPPCLEVVHEAKTSTLPSLIDRCIPTTSFGSLTTRVFNKEIIRVDSARDLTDPVERNLFFREGYTALLALPIHTTSGEIGIVGCSHSSGARPWRDFEVELLQAVSDQLAFAIDQAQLLHQSRTATLMAQEQAAKLEHTLDELRETQCQLVQSAKMSSLGQLVAGVAHEINNPVSFIYGNLTYINQYTEDLLDLVQRYQEVYPQSAALQAVAEDIDLDFIREDLPKILGSMKMGTERISQIVLSLRNFSRVDQAEMKQVDIHEGIDNTLLILAHRLQAKQMGYRGIQVIKDYGNLPLVQCYAGQLNQVFMNILTNAIEAIEEYNTERSLEDIKNYPSAIWICTEVLADRNQVVIVISDNGPGMTQEVAHRLFEPFFTTKPVGSGTGLGMSISYQIVVKKHRGQVQCISAPGYGTAFLIYIPIQQFCSEFA